MAFGADDENETTRAVRDRLVEAGHEVVEATPSREWPEVGAAVGRAVVGDAADLGVVMCWTGTGVSIAANKVPGVRAALCTDAETARGARRWNDANVLAMGLRLTAPEVAKEMVGAFLTTEPEESERAQIALLD